MNITDWVLAGAILLAALSGWRWGTINVVAKIGAVVLGYYLARQYAGVAAASLAAALPGLSNGIEGNEKLLAFFSLFVRTDGLGNRLIEILVFIVIFVIVCWLVKRIAYAMTGLFGRGLLGTVNRALGAVLSFAIMLAVIIILDDIVFPAMSGMGLGDAPLAFMDSSLIVMPALRSLLALF